MNNASRCVGDEKSEAEICSFLALLPHLIFPLSCMHLAGYWFTESLTSSDEV